MKRLKKILLHIKQKQNVDKFINIDEAFDDLELYKTVYSQMVRASGSYNKFLVF